MIKFKPKNITQKIKTIGQNVKISTPKINPKVVFLKNETMISKIKTETLKAKTMKRKLKNVREKIKTIKPNIKIISPNINKKTIHFKNELMASKNRTFSTQKLKIKLKPFKINRNIIKNNSTPDFKSTNITKIDKNFSESISSQISNYDINSTRNSTVEKVNLSTILAKFDEEHNKNKARNKIDNKENFINSEIKFTNLWDKILKPENKTKSNKVKPDLIFENQIKEKNEIQVMDYKEVPNDFLKLFKSDGDEDEDEKDDDDEDEDEGAKDSGTSRIAQNIGKNLRSFLMGETSGIDGIPKLNFLKIIQGAAKGAFKALAT